jgi:hypothetical protein
LLLRLWGCGQRSCVVHISTGRGLAASLYQEARANDTANRELNPEVMPPAGQSIEQRQIRLLEREDPSGKRLPTIVQSLNPKNQIWENGATFGKFLQERFEWELFEVVQRETEAKEKKQNSTGDISSLGHSVELLDFANRDKQFVDALFDTDTLRVIISRDPQKIGEMSTGQRWRSCMSRPAQATYG